MRQTRKQFIKKSSVTVYGIYTRSLINVNSGWGKRGVVVKEKRGEYIEGLDWIMGVELCCI
jgi:hypothetical protein